MTAISGPGDGPVAVTGASGFIGAHVVNNLVKAGYAVRGCMRDVSREDKTAYLKDIGAKGPGSVELLSVNLMDAASGGYDDAFAGCSAVFHVAADIGTDKRYGPPSRERMYASLLDMTAGVLESCRKSGTVKRVVYTSSTAAVMGPGAPDRPDNYMYTEDDWSGGSYETLDARYTRPNKDGKMMSHWTAEHATYAKGKVDAERYGYDFGAKHGIDVISICPCHVLGPLFGKPHDTLWQHRIGLMLSGTTDLRGDGLPWNIVDVRDIAEAQRLAAESPRAANGSRYMLVATDESGEPSTRMLIDMLGELYPNINVAGDYYPPPTDARLRARCTKAIEELGLVTHNVRDTLKDTGDSLIALGVIEPAYKQGA